VFESNYSGNRRDKSGSEDHLHQKCQIQNYQNKDRLSVCTVGVGYFYYSGNLRWAIQNPRLGRIATRGVDISGLEVYVSCFCTRAGVANQSRDQEPHFLLCYSKEPHHGHYTWAYMNMTPSLPYSHRLHTFA